MNQQSDLVENVVRRVFPSGSELVGARDVAPNERYIVLPDRNGPRWIIPENARIGLAFLRQWSPSSVMSRLKWKALMGAYRMGVLGRVPGVVRIGVAGAGSKDWGHVGWSESQPPCAVIHIGFFRTRRKAASALVDTGNGRPVMMAKIPIEPSAAKNIAHEADILSRLSAQNPGVAPRLYYFNKESGVSSQEVVFGKPAGPRLTRAHFEFLLRLAMGREQTSFKNQTVRLEKKMIGIVNSDAEARKLLDKSIEILDRPEPLPAMWVHGDFAPWNLVARADDTICAYDWESSWLNGPPLYDFFKFIYTQATKHDHARSFIAESKNSPLYKIYAEPLGIDDRVYALCAILFLAYHLTACLESASHHRTGFFSSELAQAIRHIP